MKKLPPLKVEVTRFQNPRIGEQFGPHLGFFARLTKADQLGLLFAHDRQQIGRGVAHHKEPVSLLPDARE